MLTTFEIAPHIGRICYVTNKSRGYLITIECPQEQLALQFNSSEPLKIGSWIKIWGTTRINTSSKKTRVYYHVPHNHSNQATWIFNEMSSADFEKVGPPQIMDQMQNAIRCLRRHKERWDSNQDVNKLTETLAAVKTIEHSIELELSERQFSSISTPNINV